jgi:hypothetical protein
MAFLLTRWHLAEGRTESVKVHETDVSKQPLLADGFPHRGF